VSDPTTRLDVDTDAGDVAASNGQGALFTAGPQPPTSTNGAGEGSPAAGDVSADEASSAMPAAAADTSHAPAELRPAEIVRRLDGISSGS